MSNNNNKCECEDCTLRTVIKYFKSILPPSYIEVGSTRTMGSTPIWNEWNILLEYLKNFHTLHNLHFSYIPLIACYVHMIKEVCLANLHGQRWSLRHDLPMLVKVVDENWMQGKFEILRSLEFEDQANHPTLLWKFKEEWVKYILSPKLWECILILLNYTSFYTYLIIYENAHFTPLSYTNLYLTP